MGVEVLEEPVGGVSHLSQVEDVRGGVVLRASRDRGPPHDYGPVARVRAPDDVVDVRPLDVHPRRQHDVGPPEIRLGRALRILVDEPHVPRCGQVRGDDQQALGRHERPHAAAKKRIRVLERAERLRVLRKHAQDPAATGWSVRRAHDFWRAV